MYKREKSSLLKHESSNLCLMLGSIACYPIAMKGSSLTFVFGQSR